jgi:hypothetical protein
MTRVLIVSKDLGTANMVVPLVPELSVRGAKVSIISEGRATERLKEHGIEPDFAGSVDWRTDPFLLNAIETLDHYQPDVVLVGLGSPIHLEQKIAWAANDRRIPLVLLEDFWGSAKIRCSGARPEAILVIDAYAKELAERSYKVEATIVGNPGAIPFPTSHPDIDALRSTYDRIFVYSGDDASTEDEIALILASLEKTPGNWRLIPRYHPKYASQSSRVEGKTKGELWDDLLSPVSARVVRPDIRRTEEVVAASDLTLSGYSTLLTTAAVSGRTPVSLSTEKSRQSLRAESGLDQVPIVALGCAHSLSEPADLSLFLPNAPAIVSALLKPYDAALAADTVLRI